MKIVIDIPEEDYDECKRRYNMIFQEGYINYNLNTALVMYIALGKPIEESKEDTDQKSIEEWTAGEEKRWEGEEEE